MPKAMRSGKHRTAAIWIVAACLVARITPVLAECAPEPQGEGRVVSVEDARTLRLEDGRLVRLTGLAPLRGSGEIAASKALAQIAVGRLVSLHGDDDKRDRYGRQRAFVFAEGASASLQQTLLAAGHGIRDIGFADIACRRDLESAENKARNTQLGHWAAPLAIKNAESTNDILSEIGHFTLLGGRVHSVRESGGWTYLNFGRRWCDGFAAMVPKGIAAAFEKAGQPLKGFEGRNVRIRGFVQKRGGPRIEISSLEQIEMADRDRTAVTGTRD